jgi:hypothetical protein
LLLENMRVSLTIRCKYGLTLLDIDMKRREVC